MEHEDVHLTNAVVVDEVGPAVDEVEEAVDGSDLDAPRSLRVGFQFQSDPIVIYVVFVEECGW